MMAPHPDRKRPPDSWPVAIPLDGDVLRGDLTMPSGVSAAVLFVHGSGSGRGSPRNRYVARLFNQAGLATLLVDLLTEREARLDEVTMQYRFDIPLLARRVTAATQWLRDQEATKGLPVGYFGASTGAAAALIAAAGDPHIFAVVSRGGRPDLAAEALEAVKAPTLLLVGGKDRIVLELNRAALAKLRCEAELTVVPGATHLFEEPGALERVADLAARWFQAHVPADGTRARRGDQ